VTPAACNFPRLRLFLIGYPISAREQLSGRFSRLKLGVHGTAEAYALAERLP